MYPYKAKTEKNSHKPKQLSVKVLGKQMKISCPPGQEHKLQAAITELEQRVSKTKYHPGLHGSEDVLLMIALNLCNELLESQNDSKKPA